MDFVKDNLVGMADAPETCNETENGHDSQGNRVVPFDAGLLLGRGGLDELVEFLVVGSHLGHLFGGADVALAQRGLGSCRSRHDATVGCQWNWPRW